MQLIEDLKRIAQLRHEPPRPRQSYRFACGIVIVAAISWLVLHYAPRIVDAMGRTGVNALTRIMGLILVCIGVHFVVTGVVDLVTSQTIISAAMGWVPG